MRIAPILGALLALAACAHESSPPPARTAAAPLAAPVPAPAAAPGQPGVPNAVLVACREEAERATVAQNRGSMMRLDEAENRGRDSLFQNSTERGLLVTTRDRLFRQCLARNAPTPAQAATPPR
jgi:hypothetical protein